MYSQIETVPSPNLNLSTEQETKILLDKAGLQIKKSVNDYQKIYDIHFILENPNMILTNIVNFELVNLLYALNKDIYEEVEIEYINENEGFITVIMKNMFEDIGLPQYYYSIQMHKRIQENHIIFDSIPNRSSKPKNVPNDAELLDIENFSIKSTVLSPHKIFFTFSIVFLSNKNQTTGLSAFTDKLLVIVLQKIYNRLKQFIEKEVRNI